MNADEKSPPVRSRYRVVMNALWLVVGGALALEVGWIAAAELAVHRHNAEIVSISSGGHVKMPAGWFVTITGTRVDRTAQGHPISFVIIEGHMSEAEGCNAGSERVSFDAGRSPTFWLHVTRSHRIKANTRPARVFYLQRDQVEWAELPPDITDQQLFQWLRDMPYEGTAAFKRWAEGKK